MTVTGSEVGRAGGRGRRVGLVAAAVMALVLGVAPSSQAVHFYRGPSGDCTATDGPITDDATPSGPPAAATILVLHNTFNDTATGLPVTTISVGGTVEWQWASSHCHSVQSGSFYSGFHYPSAPPDSPQVVPGFAEYPVPDLTPTLSYRHTFTAPGTYTYMCEHHAAIGMVGTVVVQ